ncbi:MAG: hypothetical protein GVY14_04065 [Spirochaetes bacterium]|nr:hypothetical protein [Spirochaetota bacterium]
MHAQRSVGLVALALMILFGSQAAWSQQELGLGMNDTAPRLLGAVRSAAPSASRVESASAAGTSGDARAADLLPRTVDLSEHMPTPGHQGPIGSCGAWASAYALRSYQENVERGWGADSDSEVFSPSFLYNLFSDGEDRGAHFPGLFALLEKRGCATLATMPYTTDLTVSPGEEALEEAQKYRILSYERLDPQNLEALKTVLADGEPVVFGAMLYRDFISYDGGVYTQRSPQEYGRHGMTLSGYDDDRQAFRLINSWGTNWGEEGYAWMSYDTFRDTAFEAYRVEDQVEIPQGTVRAPASVRASDGASVDMVRISWKPVGAPAFFRVYRADNASGRFELIGTARNPGYRDESALPGVEYLYAVRSVSISDDGSERESPMSAVAIGRRAEPDPQSSPPGTPGELAASVDGRAVRVSWSYVDGADGYRVYRFDDEKSDFVEVGRTGDTGFLDETTEGSDTVSYVVTAFNESGEGQASRAVTVSISAATATLGAPDWIGVDDRAGPGRQRLRWTAVEGAEAYRIERFASKLRQWIPQAQVQTTSWLRDEWDTRGTYRVVPLAGTREGNASHGVVMGRLGVDEETFDDAAYRDAEWQRRRRELGFSRTDDRVVPGEARTTYRGSWDDRDLFDFEEIQSFFEEARRAEEEAFRKFRADEDQAFEEFLQREQDR